MTPLPCAARDNRQVAQLALCKLGPADHAGLARFLDRDPVSAAYLRSELRLNPSAPSWWGVADSARELRAALLGGPLVVPWIPDPADAPALAQALPQQGLPRMLVGPAESVRALSAAMSPWRRPVERRDPQPLLVLDRGAATASGERAPLRRAGRGDLEALTVAAAAMHREEMGVDPLQIDSVAWRSRMVALVDRGWSFLWAHSGEVIFKAELSAWTPEVVQVQGVWTNPQHRRGGVAFAGMAALCTQLFRDVPVCSLYVNNYNDVALRLYRRLGFRQAGEFATYTY